MSRSYSQILSYFLLSLFILEIHAQYYVNSNVSYTVPVPISYTGPLNTQGNVTNIQILPNSTKYNMPLSATQFFYSLRTQSFNIYSFVEASIEQMCIYCYCAPGWFTNCGVPAPITSVFAPWAVPVVPETVFYYAFTNLGEMCTGSSDSFAGIYVSLASNSMTYNAYVWNNLDESTFQVNISAFNSSRQAFTSSVGSDIDYGTLNIDFLTDTSDLSDMWDSTIASSIFVISPQNNAFKTVLSSNIYLPGNECNGSQAGILSSNNTVWAECMMQQFPSSYQCTQSGILSNVPWWTSQQFGVQSINNTQSVTANFIYPIVAQSASPPLASNLLVGTWNILSLSPGGNLNFVNNLIYPGSSVPQVGFTLINGYIQQISIVNSTISILNASNFNSPYSSLEGTVYIFNSSIYSYSNQPFAWTYPAQLYNKVLYQYSAPIDIQSLFMITSPSSANVNVTGTIYVYNPALVASGSGSGSGSGSSGSGASSSGGSGGISTGSIIAIVIVIVWIVCMILNAIYFIYEKHQSPTKRFVRAILTVGGPFTLIVIIIVVLYEKIKKKKVDNDYAYNKYA